MAQLQPAFDEQLGFLIVQRVNGEAVLLQRVRLTHTRVTGDHCTRYDHELIGRARDGELLPTLIEGLTFEELRDLNDQFNHTDNELITALDNALRSAGFDGWGLKVYHPKGNNDERRVYAPDAVRAQHPEISEPEVVLQLREIGAVWEQLFPEERRRIVQLLIERVTLGDAGIEITWRAAGWPTLASEMRPGSIGAELLELEQQEALL